MDRGADLIEEQAAEIQQLREALQIARNHFPADIDMSIDETADLAKIDWLIRTAKKERSHD